MLGALMLLLPEHAAEAAREALSLEPPHLVDASVEDLIGPLVQQHVELVVRGDDRHELGLLLALGQAGGARRVAPHLGRRREAELQ